MAANNDSGSFHCEDERMEINGIKLGKKSVVRNFEQCSDINLITDSLLHLLRKASMLSLNINEKKVPYVY